jgi:hypothetical protein
MCSVAQQRFVQEIVDVLAAHGEELGIFFTKNPIAQNASAHDFPLVDETTMSSDITHCGQELRRGDG